MINGPLLEAISRFTGEDVTAFRQSLDLGKSNLLETEMKKAEGQVQADGFSSRVEMSYTAPSGTKKERLVIIRRVLKNYLDIFCLDINAPRIIKINSIDWIKDVKTNKIYEDISFFLSEKLGVQMSSKKSLQKQEQISQSSTLTKGETKTAIDRCRHEITAFVFIAGVDGERSETEFDKIIKYAKTRCPDLVIDDAVLREYLDTLYPDKQSFHTAMERILGKDGWIVRMFLEHLFELVESDGKKDDRDLKFLADLMAVLQEEGFEIEFDTK